MAVLSALSIAGYRCFAEETRLELRPLTLLFGRNSAGKSSLLRLLPILGRSVTDSARSPLDLSGPEGGDASFLDALSKHGTGRELSLALSWSDEGHNIEDRFVLRYEDEIKRVYVKSIVSIVDGARTLSVGSRPHPEIGVYDVEGQSQPSQIQFVGLVPEEPPSAEELPALRVLRRRLRSTRQKIQWLDARPAKPPRKVQTSGASARIAHDGDGAAEMIVQDKEILARVGGWYRKPPISRDLRFEGAGADESHLLLDPIERRLGVNLADTGDGMTQVLPLLAASAVAERDGEKGILAVEDPGSLLHDDAKRLIAEHMCEIASGQAPPRMIVETHSRVLLLAVQLAISRGLPPERVAAYWVEQGSDGRSKAQLIEFEADGSPKSAIFAGVMAEDRALARALLSLQRASWP